MVVLDGIVVLLAFILNPIAKRRKAQAKAEQEAEMASAGGGHTSLSFTAPPLEQQGNNDLGSSVRNTG